MLNPGHCGSMNGFILGGCFSLASLYQQALANNNLFFMPKSQPIRFLTRRELIYLGLDLASFRSFRSKRIVPTSDLHAPCEKVRRRVTRHPPLTVTHVLQGFVPCSVDSAEFPYSCCRVLSSSRGHRFLSTGGNRWPRDELSTRQHEYIAERYTSEISVFLWLADSTSQKCNAVTWLLMLATGSKYRQVH